MGKEKEMRDLPHLIEDFDKESIDNIPEHKYLRILNGSRGNTKYIKVLKLLNSTGEGKENGYDSDANRGNNNNSCSYNGGDVVSKQWEAGQR